MFEKTWPLTLVLGTILPPIAPAARADVNNVAQLSISPSFSGGSGPYSQTVTQPGPISISGSATGGLSSSGDATNRVDYGVIRLRGESFGAIGCPTHSIFRDSITITSPGVPTGTQGTLTFKVRVDGYIAASNGLSASTWGLQADLGGGFYDISTSGKFNSPDNVPSGYSGAPFGDFVSATIHFQFGFAMPLTVELSANASAGYGNSGAGVADYNVSLHWIGIQNVKANGTPVATFDASSTTGTDWSHEHCSSDFNGDGFVDPLDYNGFINAFEAGDMSADFNNDGFLDPLDYNGFINAFEAGC